MEYKIINFVRKNSFFYDRSSPLFKSRVTKLRMWKELSEELGAEVSELQKRWKTLRDRFRREDKRHIQSGTSNPIKWKYYKSLCFLKGYDETETMFFPNESCTNNGEEARFQEYIEDTKHFQSVEDSRVPPLPNTDEYESQQMQSPPPKRKRLDNFENRSENKILQELNSMLDRAKESFESKSMVKAFFTCMANQVEQANLSFDRLAYVQQEVLRVINEQIKEQRQEDSVTSVEYPNLV